MNQQQLQIERAARWRQNGEPLLTLDSAAEWLDETGLCLFLPRYSQLPVPAPSLIEACAGKAAAVHTPAAIASAMEMVTRLSESKRGVPLNLMGGFTEQPDFLASPDALRWIASVRGDRNWKAAPAGRTAPIVARVWEALDAQARLTAGELTERLGRALTEGAVLRALIELWTNLRAFPAYVPGEPTRWSLGKQVYAKELAAGANTSQTTALSALISLYLKIAVAATEEEVELFLSPLTARSRIREVLHGMLAARHFGTIAIGVNTLLFLEGSLPEFAAEPEAAEAPAQAPGEHRTAEAPRPFRSPRPERREHDRERKPPFRGPKRDFQKPWQKRGEFRAQPEGAREQRSRPEAGRQGGWKAPQRGDRQRPDRPWQPRPERAQGPATQPSATQPSEKRPARPEGGAGDGRPQRPARFEKRPGPFGKRPGGFAKRPGGEGRPPRREGSGQRPWQKKPFPGRPGQAAGPERRQEGREERPAGEREFRREGEGFRGGDRRPPSGNRREGGFRPGRGGKPGFGAKKFGGNKFGKSFGRNKPGFEARPPRTERPQGARPEGERPRRENSDREPRGEKRPFRPRPAGPGSPRSNRPGPSSSGPGSARHGSAKPGSARPGRGGKPGFGPKKFGGKNFRKDFGAKKPASGDASPRSQRPRAPRPPRGDRPPQNSRPPRPFGKPAKKGFRKPGPPGKNRSREDEA